MITFDILTLFPSLFNSVFSATVLARAMNDGLLHLKTHDLNKFATDKHKKVDDIPYGGGDGMVMKPEPIVSALESIRLPEKKVRRIYLSPQGKPLHQENLANYLQYDQIILLCGRYEGVDERVIEGWIDEEVSIGDYVLTGGEFAAMVFVDAVTRLVPGVVGNESSVRHDSFSNIDGQKLLEHPQYTRPEEFRGRKVPEILLSGNHQKIKKWRETQSLERTRRKRPDLILPE